MPLDKIKGERIGDLGDNYIVVDVGKWRGTPWFDEAAKHAQVAFGKVGGKFVHIPGLPHAFFRDDDVLVQEYRHPPALGIVFRKEIGGTEYFHPFVIYFSEGVVRDLVRNEKWRAPDRLES
jgi:hypothetical protein